MKKKEKPADFFSTKKEYEEFLLRQPPGTFIGVDCGKLVVRKMKFEKFMRWIYRRRDG